MGLGGVRLWAESVYRNAAAFSSKYRRCKVGGRHYHHGFIGNLARPAIRTSLSVTQFIQQSHSLLQVRKSTSCSSKQSAATIYRAHVFTADAFSCLQHVPLSSFSKFLLRNLSGIGNPLHNGRCPRSPGKDNRILLIPFRCQTDHIFPQLYTY